MNHGGPNSFLNVQIMAKESQGTITFEEEKSDFALETGNRIFFAALLESALNHTANSSNAIAK